VSIAEKVFKVKITDYKWTFLAVFIAEKVLRVKGQGHSREPNAIATEAYISDSGPPSQRAAITKKRTSW